MNCRWTLCKIFGSRGPRALNHASTLEELSLLLPAGGTETAFTANKSTFPFKKRRMQTAADIIENSEDASYDIVLGNVTIDYYANN